MDARGLVSEYPRAPGPLQGGQLQVGVLVLGGDTTIAYFHAIILTLISDACKRLFLQGGKPASKSLISGTEPLSLRIRCPVRYETLSALIRVSSHPVSGR